MPERLPRLAVTFVFVALTLVVALVMAPLWPRTTSEVVHSSLFLHADGYTVEAGFTQNTCGRGGDLHLIERSDAVLGWVVARSRGRSCSDVGIPHVAVTELRAPLGDRRLVNCSVTPVPGCPET